MPATPHLRPLLPLLLAGAALPATAGLSAAELTSFSETWDLRIDLGIAITDDDIVGDGNDPDFEFDSAFDLAATLQHRIPFYGNDPGPFVAWGVGIGLPYQTRDQDGTEVTTYGAVARYHLFLGWEFTESFRLEGGPTIGGGLGIVAVDVGTDDDMDYSAAGEYGGRIQALFAPGGMEFGAGIAWMNRLSSGYDMTLNGVDIETEIEQSYFEAHIMLGWEF